MDSRRKPLASVDAAWLRMDEPGNRMIVTAVLVLREPIPFARYLDLVARRLDALPRLRQRLVAAGTTLGSRVWETDPHFDLAAHVRIAPLERPDQPALQRLVGRLMGAPLDPGRPPWEMHFVPQYESGCAVVSRIHHCVGDGLALLYMLQTLTDEPLVTLTTAQSERQPADHRPASGGLLTRARAPLVSATQAVEQTLVRAGRPIIARPASVSEATRNLARELVVSAGTVWKILFMRSDSRTVFKGPLSGEKLIVWSRPILVDTLQALARATDSTLNDVVLAAVAGGLRRYLDAHAQAVDGLALRALVPVNLRALEDASALGNRFGLLFVPLPLSIADPLARVVAVRQATQRIKRSPERLLTFLILRLLGIMPSPLFEMVVTLFGRRCTVVVTNVTGPREPLRMAGATLEQVLFWVPCSAHLGTGISLISYSGNVLLGIATDGRLVPDPETLLNGLEAELAKLAELVTLTR